MIIILFLPVILNYVMTRFYCYVASEFSTNTCDDKNFFLLRPCTVNKIFISSTYTHILFVTEHSENLHTCLQGLGTILFIWQYPLKGFMKLVSRETSRDRRIHHFHTWENVFFEFLPCCIFQYFRGRNMISFKHWPTLRISELSIHETLYFHREAEITNNLPSL